MCYEPDKEKEHKRKMFRTESQCILNISGYMKRMEERQDSTKAYRERGWAGSEGRVDLKGNTVKELIAQ